MRGALLVLSIAVSVGAAAQPAAPSPEAKEFFRQAKERYGAGNYPEAVTLFRKSYELSKAPALLFNLAQAQRRAGDCAGALGSYREYLTAMPKATNAAEVRDFIAVMERCTREQSRPVQPTLVPSTPVSSPSEPEALIPIQAAPTSNSGFVGLAVASGILAAAAGGVGFGLNVSSRAHFTELQTLYRAPLVWSTEYSELERAARTQNSVSVGLLIGAGVAVAAAVVSTILALIPAPADPWTIDSSSSSAR